MSILWLLTHVSTFAVSPLGISTTTRMYSTPSVSFNLMGMSCQGLMLWLLLPFSL
jgi:hypothetical protein